MGFTDTQVGALRLMEAAYDDDLVVEVSLKTHRSGGRAFVSRQIAEKLVGWGFARYAHPRNRFLLLTDAGRLVARAG